MTQNTHRAVRAADSSLRFRVLLIGASTGGPQALRCVLSGIGADFPLPVLITQHIDASFAASFPQWLTETTGLSVQLARAHTAAQAGCVYVAPPERHLIVRRAAAGGFVLAFEDGPPVEFVKPSIDMLFFSAARAFADGCLAVLLTGMGKDGAAGCRAICRAGGYTVVESAETCAIFGMPQAAIACGGACAVLPLHRIAPHILDKVYGAR